MGLRFAFARHPRDAGAISTPAVGLLFVVAILVAAGTFAASLDDLLDDPARWGSTFDAGVGQGGGQVSHESWPFSSVDADMAALTLMGNIRVSVGTHGLDITGFEPVRGELGLRSSKVSAPVAVDEIVLGRKAARELEAGVGDDLTVQGPSGDHTLRVVGLAVIPSIEGGDGMGEGGVVTADTFRVSRPGGERAQRPHHRLPPGGPG